MPDLAHARPPRVSRARRRGLTRVLLDQASRTDGEARRRLLGEVVELNMELADSIATRYRDRGVPEEDLRQVGYVALVRAAEKFDVARTETDFVQFAIPSIRGEMRKYFRDHGWTVRPPRRVQELQPRISRAADELYAVLNRAPRVSELVAHLGEDEDDVIEALAAQGCFTPASLDQPLTGSSGTDDATAGLTLGDLQVDRESGQELVETRAMLAPAMRMLTDRERHILQRRFYDGWTQRQIGEEIGVTQMQVSRLLARALERMRARIGETAEPAVL